jgi:hypothetical protein
MQITKEIKDFLRSLIGAEESAESTPDVIECAESAHEAIEADIEGDLCVEEAAKVLNREGIGKVRVIAPGQGSSAYYPAEVLKRDGPKVFTKGLHMYWNHPTKQEAAQRPERDARDLAAVLESDAEWQDNGPKGPGLYASVKAFKPFREHLNEIGQHIGVSIRAGGTAVKGTVNNVPTYVMQEFSRASSVDFVTKAGAGGAFIEAFESIGREARELSADTDAAPSRIEGQENNMDEKILQRLDALEADNKALKTDLKKSQDRLAVSEAKDKARVAVAEKTKHLHKAVAARVSESVLNNVPVNEAFQLDEAALETQVKESIASETAYVNSVLGGNGRITGLGTSVDTREGKPEDVKKAVEETNKRFQDNRKVIFQGV